MKLGPFDLGRVHLGDCRELMPLLPDESLPMIFTDPPYGHNNNDGDLIHNWEKALGERPTVASAARPIANDGPIEAWAAFTGMLREAGRVLRKPDHRDTPLWGAA